VSQRCATAWILVIVVLIVTLCADALFGAELRVEDFGAIANDGLDDRAAIQRAIDASSAGDVIQFTGGRYTINSTLNIRGQRSYRGVRLVSLPGAWLGTVIEARIGDQAYAIRGVGQQQDLAFTSIQFNGGGASFEQGNVRNLKFFDVQFVNAASRTFGGAGPAVFFDSASDGVDFDRCEFRDGKGYGIIAFHLSNFTVRNSRFRNLRQGVHFNGLWKNVTFENNLIERMIRMGAEMQRHGDGDTRSKADGVYVRRNIIREWREPFRDSFGLSIVPDLGVNVFVEDNYIDQSMAADTTWNRETEIDGQGKRFGYGIEYGAKSGAIRRNVVAGKGPSYVKISVTAGGEGPAPAIPVEDNRLYGPTIHGFIGTHAGGAAPALANNVLDGNAANAPPAPSWGVVQPVGNLPTNVRVWNVTDTRAMVTWDYAGSDAEGYTVTFMPGNPDDAVRVIIPPGGERMAELLQGRPRWRWKVTVTVRTATGARDSTEVVEFQNLAAPATQPSTQPSTQPTTKPATQPATNPVEIELMVPPATQPSRYRRVE
jgi:hypothetical protein